MILAHGGSAKSTGLFFFLIALGLQSCSNLPVSTSPFSRLLDEREIPAQQRERIYQGDQLFLASRYDDANRAYLQVLRDQEANSETSASTIYMTLYRLATLAEVGKRFDTAIRYYKTADDRFSQQTGTPGHEPKRIKGYLGAIFLAKGMLGKNRSELSRHLALYKRVSDGKHPFIGFCHHQLGRLALAEGDRGAAENHFKQSLVSLEQNVAPDHPYLAVVMDDYAHLLLRVNRREDADPLFRQSVAIRQKYPEKQHALLYIKGVVLVSP